MNSDPTGTTLAGIVRTRTLLSSPAVLHRDTLLAGWQVDDDELRIPDVSLPTDRKVAAQRLLILLEEHRRALGEFKQRLNPQTRPLLLRAWTPVLVGIVVVLHVQPVSRSVHLDTQIDGAPPHVLDIIVNEFTKRLMSKLFLLCDSPTVPSRLASNTFVN